MVFFSLFVVGAVILGAGAMLSPAWPSQAPRIGLSSTLLLGLVSGGAVWWSSLFGWDTLIIDYLLFAIVSGVILGGTMAQRRDSVWPSRKELAFLALAALICMMPLFVLRLPLGYDASSDALISLSVRESGSFDSLAPFEPDARGFAPPAFHALAAYLSQQLRQPIPDIHLALGAFIAFLCVWTVYDLGAELRDKRLGFSMAIALLGSVGMLSLLWGSAYSQLMSLLFAFAFISYALRYYRQHKWIDMLAAGLMLGAVLYTSPMLFITLLYSYYLWLIILRLPVRRQPSKDVAPWSRQAHFGSWFGILLICIFAVAGWAAKNWEVINYIPPSWDVTFPEPPPSHFPPLLQLVLWHGTWIFPVSLLGIFMARRWGQGHIAWFAILNSLMILYAASVGILPRWSIIPLLNPHHYRPEILASFLPVIPYTLLGGFGLLGFFERLHQSSHRLILILIGLCGLLTLLPDSLPAILEMQSQEKQLYTDADFAAMDWLIENAEADAIVLNHNHSPWTMQIIGRHAVFFPAMPMRSYRCCNDYYQIWDFWRNPLDSEALLLELEIDYVLVPEWVSYDWRIAGTFYPTASYRNEEPREQDVYELESLRLVFEQGGARVYQVVMPE